MPANIRHASQLQLSPSKPSVPHTSSSSSHQNRHQLNNELLWRSRHHRHQQQQDQQIKPTHINREFRIRQRPVSTRAVVWLACLYTTFYIAGVHIIKRADLILGPELFASLFGVTHEHLLKSDAMRRGQAFALSEHLPAIDDPFITRFRNICPSAPWQHIATSSIPVSCQSELSDLIYAYHVALNNDRVSILQCAPPLNRKQMHSIIRLEKVAPALEQYEQRVGGLANLIAYEGAWRSNMPDDGVLLRILQIVGLDSGGNNVVNILSPITISSFGRSSSAVWLAKDCGWVGRVVVLSAHKHDGRPTATTALRAASAQSVSLTTRHEYSFAEFRDKIKNALGMENKVDRHNFEFEDEGREEGLEVLTVNLGTRNDFHVLALIFQSVVPQIVSVRFSFAAGDVLDVVATPQWGEEEQQQQQQYDYSSDKQELDWDGTCVMSASIRAFEVLAQRYGYQVVHVTSTHVYMMHKLIWQQHASLGLTVERLSVRSMYRRQTVIANFGGFSAPAVKETISECTKRWQSHVSVSARVVLDGLGATMDEP